MANSALVNYTKLSPFYTGPRNKPITKLTPHHVAGNATVETVGQIFTTPGRNASCNYSVGSDGRIGLHCEEKNRSWCSSSATNDNTAITFEIANNSGAPGWTVSDKAWESFINLCVDIIRRNPGIQRKDGRPGLYCDDTPNASLTFHRYFSATGCASPWIWERRQQLCTEVNKRLDALNNVVVIVPEVAVPAPVLPSTPNVSVESIVYTFFRGKGLNDFAVSGLMGNLYAESSMIANNVQGSYKQSNMTEYNRLYTEEVDKGEIDFVNDKTGGGGYGLAQWTYPTRKKALLDYAKSTKRSIGDLNMQLEFLWNELQGYKNTMGVLKVATSVRQASDIVLTDFERPANMGEEVKIKRASYGQGYFNKYAGQTLSPIPPVVTPVEAPVTPLTSVKPGDVVKLVSTATYYDGKPMPSWVLNDSWIVSSVNGDRVVLGMNVSKVNNISSAVNSKFLIYSVTAAPTFKEYQVKVTATALNYRKGPGTNYVVNGTIYDQGKYTIIEEGTGAGATKWGKLKSGAGWISLDLTSKVA